MSEKFTHQSLLGAKLGVYAIRDLIDDEGAGAVWRAEDAHGTPWTVKVFQPAASIAENDEELRTRFELLRAIRHPNLVELKELHRLDDDRVAVVMEHLYGQDLAQQLVTRKRIPPEELLAILGQSLSALERLHQGFGGESVILGGLTPRRIFRQNNGTVKLLTFDIGRFSTAPKQAQAAIAPWLSPEQVQGYPPDLRANLYAVGAVAYASLCGTPPFAGETLEEVAAAQLRARTTPLVSPSRRAATGEVSDLLDAVTLKALAIDPDERYVSAFEMARAITRLQSRTAAAKATHQKQARPRPTVLILGEAGAGKTTWLSLLYRELTSRQGRFCADVRGPDDRDYLEAQLALLRKGKFPPPTANEQPRRLEFSMRRRGRPLGPVSFVEYAGRLAECISPEHPGPLPDLLQPTDGLILLLDPQRLHQPESRRETLRKMRVAVDAIVERQQPSRVSKGQNVKLDMPIALVLGKADLLASKQALAKQRTVIRSAVQTLRDDLRPFFIKLCIFELTCLGDGKATGKKEKGESSRFVTGKAAEATVKPLAFLLNAMRPSAMHRAQRKLMKIGAVLVLAMALLGCWIALNFYRIQTAGYAIINQESAASGQTLEQRIGQLNQLLDEKQGSLLLFTRRMLYRNLGYAQVKPYEAEQKAAEAVLKQLYANASAQPEGFPESSWRANWLTYERRWHPETGEATAALNELRVTMELESNLDWCLEKQQERYDTLRQKDTMLQLAYQTNVTLLAPGIITAREAIEAFQQRHLWSEVKSEVEKQFRDAGPDALIECRRLVNDHLDVYTRAAIPPTKEAQDWQEGLNLIVETTGVLENLDLQRDFARAVQVFEELKPRTQQLPLEAMEGLADSYEIHRAWQDLALQSLDFGEDAARQIAAERIKEFRSHYSTGTLNGSSLGKDASKLLLVIDSSLQKPFSGAENIRLKLDSQQLTATPLAWKLLLDVAWTQQVKKGAATIRQEIAELKSNQRTSISAPTVDRVELLIEECRKYQQWDQERLTMVEQSASMIDRRRAQYCQNLTYQVDENWQRLPAIQGTIDLLGESNDRHFSLKIHQQNRAVDLDPDENDWTDKPQKFIFPAAAVDWKVPLRLEAAVEVDRWINKTYHVRKTFSPSGPLIMLLFDNREYGLTFTNGSNSVAGVIKFGENFSLPYLLDSAKPLF